MDQLAGTLAQIAEKLGLAADHLWPQIVLRVYFQAIALVVLDVVILFGTAVLTRFLLGYCNRRRAEIIARHEAEFQADRYAPKSDYGTENWNGAIVLIVVAACVVVLATLCLMPEQIATIASPEGGTALRLLGK